MNMKKVPVTTYGASIVGRELTITNESETNSQKMLIMFIKSRLSVISN